MGFGTETGLTQVDDDDKSLDKSLPINVNIHDVKELKKLAIRATIVVL